MVIRSSKITIEILQGQNILDQGHIMAQKLWNYTWWCCFGYNEKLAKTRQGFISGFPDKNEWQKRTKKDGTGAIVDWPVIKKAMPYQRGEGYPGGFTLQKELKDYWAAKDLADRCFSYTIKDFDIAVKSWFSNLKVNPNARPPRYAKLPRILNFEVGRNAKPVGNMVYRLTVLGGHIPDRHCLVKLNIRPGIKMSQIKLIRLQPDRTGVITYSVPVIENNGQAIAGIDLGIINLAAVAFDNGESILYSGKGLLAAMQWLQKRSAACKPSGWQRGQANSNQSPNFRKIRRKAGNIQNLAVHNLTTDIIRQCLERGVKTIIIGDLTKIREDKDFGKAGNQRLHNWPFAEIRRQITYKAEEVDIEVIAKNERGTSSHCCFCGQQVSRNPRGLVKCKNCKAIINSDLNGAFNILNKVSPEKSGVEGVLPALPSPLKKSPSKNGNGNRPSSQIDPTFIAKFNLRNWSIEQAHCTATGSGFDFCDTTYSALAMINLAKAGL